MPGLPSIAALALGLCLAACVGSTTETPTSPWTGVPCDSAAFLMDAMSATGRVLAEAGEAPSLRPQSDASEIYRLVHVHSGPKIVRLTVLPTGHGEGTVAVLDAGSGARHWNFTASAREVVRFRAALDGWFWQADSNSCSPVLFDGFPVSIRLEAVRGSARHAIGRINWLAFGSGPVDWPQLSRAARILIDMAAEPADVDRRWPPRRP